MKYPQGVRRAFFRQSFDAHPVGNFVEGNRCAGLTECMMQLRSSQIASSRPSVQPCQLCRGLRYDAGQRGSGVCLVFLDSRDLAASLPDFHIVTIAQSARPGCCGCIVGTFLFALLHEFVGRFHNTESIEAHAALRYLEPGARTPFCCWCPRCLSSASR